MKPQTELTCKTKAHGITAKNNKKIKMKQDQNYHDRWLDKARLYKKEK